MTIVAAAGATLLLPAIVLRAGSSPCSDRYSVPGAGHVDLYDRAGLIPFDRLEEFFTRNLA